MNLDLEALKEKNQGSAAQMLKPYQPLVYAIPQDQWGAILSMMTDNLPLLPEIDTLVEMAPTKQDVYNMEMRIRHEVIESGSKLNRQMSGLSSQVGKTRESVSESADKVMADISSQCPACGKLR